LRLPRHIGIGRQVAISFAREGCKRIALLDKDEEGMSETSRLVRETNDRARSFIIPLDVSSEKEVRLSVECVIDEWGRIDYAVNCAGELSFFRASNQGLWVNIGGGQS
jgi:NAD(P)-dependent dehydrogenase (short-subunit alcohol dehydrogenase family)